MADIQLIEALINSNTRLAIVESGDPDSIVDWLRQQYTKTGRAGYVWTAQQGLQRISIEHIPIPNTHNPLDVMKHINSSHHYGIYLLCNFHTGIADPQVYSKLEQLISDTDSVRKLVLLCGTEQKLPRRLDSRVEKITLNCSGSIQNGTNLSPNYA